MSSIFVIVYPPAQHNVVAPGALYYRNADGSQSGPLPPQEAAVANPHFVGRFAPSALRYLQGLRQNPAPDVPPPPPAPETNVHFVGRFAPPALRLLRALIQNPDTSESGPSPAPFETNVHFVGRFAPPALRYLQDLRQNPALDMPLVVLVTGGFVHHWTGVGVPDSKLLAMQMSNADLFERFVPYPVDFAIYEAPQIDIGFTDTFQFYTAGLHATLGRGVVGAVALKMQIDAWADGMPDPAVWSDLTTGTLTARFVRARIVMALGNAPGAGAPAYVDTWTPAATKQPQQQTFSIVAAPGGSPIVFNPQYHNVPIVQVTGGAGLVAWRDNVTATGCTVHAGPDAATDTGGAVDVTVTGV